MGMRDRPGLSHAWQLTNLQLMTPRSSGACSMVATLLLSRLMQILALFFCQLVATPFQMPDWHICYTWRLPARVFLQDLVFGAGKRCKVPKQFPVRKGLREVHSIECLPASWSIYMYTCKFAFVAVTVTLRQVFA
jgi:hypothetical protein